MQYSSTRKSTLAVVALIVASAAVPGLLIAASAQTSVSTETLSTGSAFPDTPQNHWAYEAVQDLANKGLVKGYPDGKFLGERALSRYEFASVVDRLLQTLEDIKSSPTPAAVAPQITQDDLNKIQVLVDTFQTQLNAIQDNVTKAQSDIESLRQDVVDTKALVKKSQDTADSSYGSSLNRKFAISGYIQVRFQDAMSGSRTQFPTGSPASNSPYNGNFAQGGSRESINVRRARIKFTGQVTANTKYAIQLDAAGVVNPSFKTANSTPPASNSFGILGTSDTSINVKEANLTYTPGNGSAAYPSITVGQFGNIFGFQLPQNSAIMLSPEKCLAFGDISTGLFYSLDFVRGAQISYTRGLLHFAAAVDNGNGYASTNTSTAFEQIYRLNYQSKDKVFGLGVSYDKGPVNTAVAAPTSGVIYTLSQKQLVGFDAQVTLPSGPFILGEYVSGPYQQVSYFKAGATGGTTVADPGNNVQGYYIQGGYTFHPKSNHPFTLVCSYDALIRSTHGTGALYSSLGSLDDVNNGYGAMYNLDKATRLRLWYTDPQSVTHIGAAPPKIGLFITELQVRY